MPWTPTRTLQGVRIWGEVTLWQEEQSGMQAVVVPSNKETKLMPILLWLLGVPLGVILLLWLVGAV